MAINDLNRPSRYYVGQDGSIHIYNRCMLGFLSDFIRFHMGSSAQDGENEQYLS